MSWGRINYYGHVRKLVDEIQVEYRNEEDINKQFSLLGVIDGMEYGKEISHNDCINNLILTKTEINDLLQDVELFENEIQYKKGYIKGLEKILNINRECFKEDIQILFIALFEEEMLLKKYLEAMKLSGFYEYTRDLLNKNNYFFSCDINEIIKVINELGNKNIELSLSIVSASKENMKIDKLLKIASVTAESTFIIFDKNEMNAKRIIDKILGYHKIK